LSGLPHWSHPDYHEVMEATGAFAENEYLRDVYEGRVLSCDHCFEREKDDFPWSCPNYCPNKKTQLEWKDMDAEMDFGAFMKAQELQTSNTTEEEK